MYVYSNSNMDSDMTYVKYDNYEFHTVPHVHREFELVYVAEGSIKVVVDGAHSVANTGECIMILPRQIHFYDCASQTTSVVVNFSGQLISSCLSQFSNSTVDKNVFVPDEVCQIMIRSYLIEQNESTIWSRKSMLYAICDCFMQQVHLVPREYPDNSPAYHVLHYVAEHYQESITLRDIAQSLGYDYHYLSKTFAQTTKVNFRDFLNCHRIECACGFLRDSDIPISEIALKCGFQNIRSFNRSFQEIMKCTPREYRHSLKDRTKSSNH